MLTIASSFPSAVSHQKSRLAARPSPHVPFHDPRRAVADGGGGAERGMVELRQIVASLTRTAHQKGFEQVNRMDNRIYELESDLFELKAQQAAAARRAGP